MKRNLSSQLSVFEQAQDNHKDIIIGTLKKQLNDLRDLETDFLRLTDEINRLESKYTLLLEQKTRNEKQHKLKMDINKKGITDMRNDVDALKIQIHKTMSLIENTTGQNSTLKKMCDNRNNDIASLMAQNRELEKNNDQQAEENRNISFNIKQLKQQKGKLESQCERLHDVLDSHIQTLKNLQKQARILQSNNAKLDNNLLQAQRDNQKLLLQLKQRQDSSLRTNKNLDDLATKLQSTKDRNRQLQGECIRLQGQCQSTNNNLSTQIGKNKQLVSKLRCMDNMIRATQSQLQQSLSKKQSLKKEHFQLIGDNKALNEQIDNCIINIVQYQKINAELQKQIENYMETDQLARSKLNRKDTMRSLLQQISIRLQKTGDQISHLRS